MDIFLEQGADLHMAQLMPLPLTVSHYSKIQIVFTFLVPAHPGGPGKRAIKCVRLEDHTVLLKFSTVIYWENLNTKFVHKCTDGPWPLQNAQRYNWLFDYQQN